MTARARLIAYLTAQGLSTARATANVDAYRTEVLAEAADEVVAYCPDHGSRNTCYLACLCPAGDDLRRMETRS